MRRPFVLAFAFAAAITSLAYAKGGAWLGVAMDKSGSMAGVPVNHIYAQSPAEKAGFREGDLIVEVEGKHVLSPTDVSSLVTAHGSGETLPVTVKRSGTDVKLNVKLEARPPIDDLMRREHVGKFAPPWATVTPIGNAPKSLAEMRGHVVVLDFWATWCGPCRMTAPVLAGWHSKFGAQGLKVVGLSSEATDLVTAFTTKEQIPFSIGIDTGAKTQNAYRVSTLPTLFFIDKRGVVREVLLGYDPAYLSQGDALIQKLLAEPAP